MSDFCDWLVAHGSSCAELFGFITGVLNVWLVTRENIWSWPLGLLNAAFYIVVFARTGLYSDTGLQVVYFVLSGYGWWHWSRGGRVAPPVVVRRAPARLLLLLAGLGVVTWLLLATVTARIPGAALPRLDAALVATSLVAQWMMTRKLLENWMLWIGVDVVYVGLFIMRGLRLTAVLYAVFLVLAVIGYVQWTRSERAHAGGRMKRIVLTGSESVGKTTLAAQLAATLRRAGGAGVRARLRGRQGRAARLPRSRADRQGADGARRRVHRARPRARRHACSFMTRT